MNNTFVKDILSATNFLNAVWTSDEKVMALIIEVSTLLELSVVWVARAAVIPAAAPRIMPAAGYTARWH